MFVGGGDVSVDRTGGDLGRLAWRLLGLDTGLEDIAWNHETSSVVISRRDKQRLTRSKAVLDEVSRLRG